MALGMALLLPLCCPAPLPGLLSCDANLRGGDLHWGGVRGVSVCLRVR